MTTLIMVEKSSLHHRRCASTTVLLRARAMKYHRPQHPNVKPNLIEEGDAAFTDDGNPIARHGHCATCGCHLMSSLLE
jgi:uncharacterized Zn-binding protein involved in type VI secretion